MKLLVTAPMLQESLDELKRYFEEIHYYPWTLKEDGNGYSEKEISALLEEYQPDALISELDELTRVVLTGYGRLKVIGDCRANPANIDLNACNELGIPVLCTPARNAQAVAELLVGMLINFFRNVQPAIRWVEEGNWVPGNMPYSTFMGNELQGKKVGFVGFGAVGQTTAGILHGFGCEISFYDQYVDSVKETFFKKELEEIFRESDIVSVHLPVLESTKGM
ncbi:MAG: 3-phosphoglycerate dehydrogenase, partial [Lachnospiraceae bacterium]|nr:3-phosphoglycerate dehydrogenase [Lachnospiraceae bacterium]